MSSEYCVYVHTNKANGMRYVGITKQKLEQRWARGYGYYKQEHFFRAIKKYGWNGFTHEVVLSGVSKEAACAEEQRLIELYQTTDNTKGYNKSTGGEAGSFGVESSELSRRLAKERMTQMWQDEAFREKRRQITVEMNKRDDIRRKRSESSKGRIVSDETRRKMSENRMGKGMGRRSAEAVKHMREHHAGGAPKSAVLCIETGKTYSCINEAARDTGIRKEQISGCCKKRPHYNTAGGYHWQYAKNET